METKGAKIQIVAMVAIIVALIAGWAGYYAQQQNNLRAREKLTTEVTGLQAQVADLENELQQAKTQNVPAQGLELRSLIQAKGDLVLLALKNKGAAALAQYIDPQQGLRFTPYTHINTTNDLVLPLAGIPALFSSTTPYTWGSYDGSGAPINLTFGGYYAKFIYDQDFLAAPQLVFNQVLQRGNMINNFTAAYPQGVSIEYYFPGFNAQYNGMDWESLKLVFEQSGGNWFLVGIIHEQWTI
jgi:outer membrane murein-binding lipoprotein Lpp